MDQNMFDLRLFHSRAIYPVVEMRIEQEHQIAVVHYLRVRYPSVVFTCAPGNAKSARQGAINKQMGYTPGIPDLLIFYPCGIWHGLTIEMKAPKGPTNKKGYPSKEQKEIGASLRNIGYRHEVCYGSDEAIKVIDDYFKPEAVK
jgi:hypothetical protein